MNLLDKLGIFLARLLTVALWVLTVVAVNEGLYGGALVVGVLSWGAYREASWDWLR